MFDVCFTGESVVKASGNNLRDLIAFLYQISTFFPAIVPNETSHEEPIILCSNNGALLVQARANTDLKSLDFYNLDAFLQAKLVRVNPDFPFQIQATEFECGGFSLTFTFDHALGDASSFGKFLTTWSEISRKEPVSCVPDHRRNLLLPRSPPHYHPLLDKTFIKCSVEDIKNIPTPKTLIKRLYHINASSINAFDRLDRESPTWTDVSSGGSGTRRTSFGLVFRRRFPVAELDFGFGAPVLGTVCSTVEKIGVGYLNQRPSACNDGSWSVSAMVWPELAAALESDSVFSADVC
ncbi:hypothetical protein HID58_037128 [Brassica napus]|uniref:Uncharacterized protein n=1 Tax=Brassica napus TaxID=3708 RepID=A0ABQ7XIB6_BRANA|nr:hypothetical protein HID58_037128 [Brassica napus]